jgi:hypothetical protein
MGPSFKLVIRGFRSPCGPITLDRMAVVRILVDGFSLLHRWPELAPGRPRHSAAARDELVAALVQFADSGGIPVTVIFDGGGAPPGTPRSEIVRGVEVMYSRRGQTADDIIERVTHRLKPYGEVLVVTDDSKERETVLSFGGMATSCRNFIAEFEAAQRSVAEDVHRQNQRERTRYRQAGLGGG